MTADLLMQLEQKVAHAVELIELMQIHIEELENENKTLRNEQERWRNDLMALIKRFDSIDTHGSQGQRPRTQVRPQTKVVEEEDYMTV